MIHITDADVERCLAAAPPGELETVLRAAFVALSAGGAAQQARIRTDAGGVKLSTLGAVLPQQGVAGAKVYTTIAGQFRFLIALFSARTGAPIATLDAGAITRQRTAVVSLLAARAAVRSRAPISNIAIFGAGVQGRSHAEVFGAAFPEATVRMLGRDDVAWAGPDGLAQIVGATDILITATRSAMPLFAGGLVAPGTFVAAVGSSRPDTRELDDALLGRAARMIVEWKEQSLREAGDWLLAEENIRAALPVVELGDVLAGTIVARTTADDIVIFKSVGVGIADIAVAGLVYRLSTGLEP